MSNLTISLKVDDTEIGKIEKDGGKDKNDIIVISSLIVKREINRIATATILFYDPGDKFEKKKIALGGSVELELGQENASLKFVGNITSIDAEITEDGTTIEVIAKALPNVLTQQFNRRPFYLGEGDDRKDVFFQNNTSDWDFLVCLADMYGAWVVQNGKDVTFLTDENAEQYNGKYHYSNTLGGFGVEIKRSEKEDGGKKKQVYTLESQLAANGGDNTPLDLKKGNEDRYAKILNSEKATDSRILKINHRESSHNQFKTFSYQAEPDQEPTTVKLASGYIPNTIENKSLKVDQWWAGFLPNSMSDNSIVSPKQLQKAREWKTRHSISRGSMVIMNSDLVDEGVKGKDEKGKINLFLGRKLQTGKDLKDLLFFNGKGDSNYSLLTAITHNITEDGWETTLEWGASPKFHVEEFPDIQHPPTVSMLPSVQGIHIAVVSEHSPDSEPTVKAHLFDSENVMTFKKLHDVKGLGHVNGKRDEAVDELENRRWRWTIMPVGTLILVSFTANDPVQGVVLGSLDSPLFDRPA